MYSGSWNAPKVKTIESFRLGGNTANFYFLWSRASKRAQRPLCFCAVFSYSFFFIFFFIFYFFFIFFVTKFVGRLSYRTPSRTELKFGR
jgi:Zn-dependent protease with chaperone function